MKIREYQNEFGDHRVWTFYCPACRQPHPYSSDRWFFNGDFERPTFTPSLRVLDGAGGTVCHLFVTDGHIHYCGDCPHQMVGQSVPVPDVEEDLL